MVTLDVLRPLLNAEQLPEAGRLVASLPSSRAVAAELQARGWLTPFQADEVGKDRAHRLVVDKYVLLERLGRGGMGDVLRARDTFMGRDVALKRIKDELRETEGVAERFLREVRAAARLNHPNVVTVHDARDANETLFMVMELLDGVDLFRFMQQQPEKRLSVASAVECVRQACEGMQHAHEKNLVHRDLKPANLVRTKAGVVKILDLGLAQLTDGATMTHTGDFMGTIDYVAPEQILDASRVDIRADVYSLGCTLYQLLCGRTPFGDVHPAARASMHLSEQEPPAIESVRPEVPAAVAAVVRKMMAKKREGRYATPGEASDALRRMGEAAPAARAVPPSSGVSPPTAYPSVVPVAAKKEGPAREFTNGIGMKFVRVEAGTFLMGSPVTEKGRSNDEYQHEVRLTKAFWMGVHPVTLGQWERFAASSGYACGDDWKSPEFAQGDDHPVTNVSWHDAVAFCEWLKQECPGHLYRLPSEAEWEYSCRGGPSGNTAPFHFWQAHTSLSSTQANFDGNHPYGGAAKGPYLKGTTPVGSYEANSLGLHDMHGNVWEWCLDWFGEGYYEISPTDDPPGSSRGSSRVGRGGCWSLLGECCRAANRGGTAPGLRSGRRGFRVAGTAG